jgi:hypothetical protein
MRDPRGRGERWGPAFASAGAAAAATLVAAFSALPILDSMGLSWTGPAAVLAWAGLLHVAIGLGAPRTPAAMAVPPFILYAWLVVAFAGILMEPSEEGGRIAAGQAFGLLAFPGFGIGAALSGFVALGAGLRERRARRQAAARRAPHP